MKRKILSLVLCLALLFTTVFAGFTVVSAEETTTTTTSENLIQNSEFANGARGWFYSTAGVASKPATEITDDLTANAVKFDSNKAIGTRHSLQTPSTIAIEKNAKYTTTFWVKLVNITSFRVFMYEPTYTDLNGNLVVENLAEKMIPASEGQNIYTYTYLGKDDDGNPTTRVSRTDIVHEFKVAETGTVIDAAGPSMFQSRVGQTNQILTPDYPSTERQGEWFQVVHTFETGNDDAHKANIRYQFDALAVEGGEFWLADIQMHVERKYLPQVNDDTLGTVTPLAGTPVVDGTEVTITAEPYGENLFAGWYDGDKLVSKEAEFTFTYQASVTPQYTAHFEENGLGTTETFEEGYTNGQLLAQGTKTLAGTADKEAGYVEFKNTEQNGSGFFICGGAGTWRNATVSADYALSGEYSLKFDGIYGGVGYKYTGLEANTYYTVSVYAYIAAKTAGSPGCIQNTHVTPGDKSYKSSSSRLANVYYTTDEQYAAQANGWNKFKIRFNTGENTEVIFWLTSDKADSYIYFDNFAIARDTVEYTPNVDNKALGYTSTVTTRVGSKTTVSATPIGESIFVGWYNGDTLLCENEEYTFIYSEEAENYEARFEGSGFGTPTPETFEEGYDKDQLLAQGTATLAGTADKEAGYVEFKNTEQNGSGFFIGGGAGTWRNAKVSTDYALSGEYSLKFDGSWGAVGYKYTDLEANTYYTASVYGYVVPKKATETTCYVDNLYVSTANNSYKNNTAKLNQKWDFTAEEKAAQSKGWTKFEIKFNTGENTDVIFWLTLGGSHQAYLYLDNFAIVRPGQTIEVETSAYGTTDFEDGNTYNYNEKVTITATPYEGNTFDGWYVDGECVSEEATHTFYAQNGLVITPKFSGDTYEYFAKNGKDGTFENGTVDGWYFADPTETDFSWVYQEVSSEAAYEGSNSLKINARHRNTILPLTGLDKNTNYTISFMFKLNETGVEDATTGEIKKTYLTTGVAASNIENIDADTVTFAKTTIDSTAEWQKAELTFNTGNNTELNLIIRFASESTAPMYLDNLTLMHKNSEVVYVSGDVDNNSNVNLNDLVTLAQYVAEWDVDAVNKAVVLDLDGDGYVTLADVTLFAKYLAGWDVTIK